MSNKTIPYEVITDTAKRVLREEIGRLTSSRASAIELDVITDEEASNLMQLIFDLKDIADDL